MIAMWRTRLDGTNRINKLSVTVLLLLSFSFATQKALASDKDNWFDLKREGQRLEALHAFEVAAKYYKQALMESKKFPSQSIESIESLYRYTNILVMQNKFWDAEVYFRRLMKLSQEAKQANQIDDEELVWLEDLSRSYSRCITGTLESSAVEHAVTLLDFVSGNRSKHMAVNLRRLCNLWLEENKVKEALPYARRLVQVGRKSNFVAASARANDLLLYGILLSRSAQYAEAEANLREAVSISSKSEIPPGPVTARCLSQLAIVLKMQKQFDLSGETAMRALRILERNNGKRSLETVFIRELLADIQTERRNYAEAIQEDEQIISILQSKSGEMDSRLLPTLRNLKLLYLKLGKSAKAREIGSRIESISSNTSFEKNIIRH